MPGAEPSPNRGVMIVLAYLWALAIVPLLVEKHDPDVQWHAKHGLVLMAAELVVIFAYMIITSIVSIAAIGLGCVMSLFFVFAWVGILALHVVAILKGVNGGRLIIPGISEYANRF
jgi:uncharacterized membrane protein